MTEHLARMLRVVQARALVLALALFTWACGPTFKYPMTAADAVGFGSGEALVAYLGQASASAAICDVRAQGPHIRSINEEVAESLAGALVDGRVTPTLWRGCVDALLQHASPEQAMTLHDATGRAYRKLLKDGDFEKEPALQEQLAAMQRFFIERPPGLDAHPDVMASLLSDLRVALAGHCLGPAATRFGEELIATVDLERGVWQGKTVDIAELDRLLGSRKEDLLLRFARRLPSPDLRAEARRRVIRLRIATSPFPELKEQGSAVEQIVMARGNDPVSLAEHHPVRGWLDAGAVASPIVRVRQDPWNQKATLLRSGSGAQPVTVLPALNLRGAVWVSVEGISRPITICAPRDDMDVAPCVEPSDISLAPSPTFLDAHGALHFREGISMGDAVGLAHEGTTLQVPLLVGGQPLLTLVWGLSFEAPQNLVFTPGGSSGVGPALAVEVDAADPRRWVFQVSAAGRTYFAVLERQDASKFRIVSRGSDGAAGVNGTPGSTGVSGGECQSGGPGGRGGDGGPGGGGGDGGPVRVQVTCSSASCAATVASLRQVIGSEGGSGGPGGAGGPGGSGGMAGSSRMQRTHTDNQGNTVVDDPGCFGGTSGMAGSKGLNGPSGPDGSPGPVHFEVKATSAASPAS